MDPEGGQQSVEKLRKAGNHDASMYIINKAGHHGELRMALTPLPMSLTSFTVYLDNPDSVNNLLMRELDVV